MSCARRISVPVVTISFLCHPMPWSFSLSSPFLSQLMINPVINSEPSEGNPREANGGWKDYHILILFSSPRFSRCNSSDKGSGHVAPSSLHRHWSGVIYALQRHRVRRSERAEGMRWGTSRETDPPNQDLTFLSPVGCGRDRNEWRERSVPSYIPFSFRSGMRREGLERNGCDKTLAIPFHSSWPEGPPDEECNDEEGTTSEWTTWVKLVGWGGEPLPSGEPWGREGDGWEGPVSGEGRVEGNQEWIMNGGSFRRSESRVVPSPHPFHHRLRRWWKGWGRREPATDDEPLPHGPCLSSLSRNGLCLGRSEPHPLSVASRETPDRSERSEPLHTTLIPSDRGLGARTGVVRRDGMGWQALHH